MYRINLYPELAAIRLNRRRRLARAAFRATLAGLEIAIVGWLLVSGFLLQERISSLRAEIPRLTARVQDRSQPIPALRIARAMMQTRLARVDWAPKLAAMAERIDPSLELSKIAGQATARTTLTKLDITGRVRGGGRPLEDVAGFLAALKADPRLAGDFPSMNLGNLGGREADRFEIHCARETGVGE